MSGVRNQYVGLSGGFGLGSPPEDDSSSWDTFKAMVHALPKEGYSGQHRSLPYMRHYFTAATPAATGASVPVVPIAVAGALAAATAGYAGYRYYNRNSQSYVRAPIMQQPGDDVANAPLGIPVTRV
jgi:hypothetical protein